MHNAIHLQALNDYRKVTSPFYRRLTHWADYVHLKTILTKHGTLWECRIGSVICTGVSPNEAVASAHRIANSIRRKAGR